MEFCKLPTSGFCDRSQMKQAFIIASFLVPTVFSGFSGGPDHAWAGQRCSLNLFQARGPGACEEKNGSGQGLFSMYAKSPPSRNPARQVGATRSPAAAPVSLVPSALPSVSEAGANVQMLSTNSELSHKGPNANAKMRGVCDGSGTARLLLEFPGYPLFVGNDHLQLAVLGNTGRGVSLVSGMGENFNQLAIHGSQALSGLSAIAAKRNNSKLVFKLKDQDGLNLKADFDAAEFRQKMEFILSRCTRT